MRLSPGRWLNSQMHLLSWLGEELHGESFLAEQRPQGRSVLVRILSAEVCRTPAYIERFRRAAERAMLLQHRHAAAVHAFGLLPASEAGADEPMLGHPAPGRLAERDGLGGVPWIATEPAEGPDLRSYLAEGLSPDTLAPLLLPVADLLDRAAALGLVHGELMPSNLLLLKEAHAAPRLLLLDLGLAKVVASDLLELPSLPGMLSYRSPEQCADGQHVEPASDRYALAVILFEAVAGRPPFQADNPRALMTLHRTAPVPPLRTLAPRLRRAEALDTFFVRALAKQPDARFSSAVAMVEEFVTALSGAQRRVGQPREKRRSPRWYRLSRQGNASSSIDVVVGPRAVLGKQSECDVICQALPSPEHDLVTATISREHAVLIWLDNRLSVLDQSSNGTFVNGRRVGPRLCELPDGALLRLGEHLTVHVTLLGPSLIATGPGSSAGVGERSRARDAPSGSGSGSGEVVGCESPGAFLSRRDSYAAGVPPTLMLWQHLPLAGSPLELIGGAMRLGQVWVAQRELWWSGHPSVSWQRRDHTTVLGPAPLRDGDTLTTSDAIITVEH